MLFLLVRITDNKCKLVIMLFIIHSHRSAVEIERLKKELTKQQGTTQG